MSLTEKPKRWFCRIHLSTALLLMMEIGVILYLNTAGWHGIQPMQEVAMNVHDGVTMNHFEGELKRIEKESTLGWPFQFFIAPDMMIGGSFLQGGLTGRLELFGDIVTFVLLLCFTALLSEYLIRRREFRKP